MSAVIDDNDLVVDHVPDLLYNALVRWYGHPALTTLTVREFRVQVGRQELLRMRGVGKVTLVKASNVLTRMRIRGVRKSPRRRFATHQGPARDLTDSQ